MTPEEAVQARHTPTHIPCSCDGVYRTAAGHAQHIAAALAVERAVQDPEGRALVQSILDRKAARP